MNQLQIQKVTPSVYRVLCDSNESGVFYVAKGRTGTWAVKQNGITLDFAPNRPMAISLAINLWEPK